MPSSTEIHENKTEREEIRRSVYEYVYYMLGGDMVDVELDPKHYEIALDKALERFRQRSENSVEESYLFLPTVTDQNDYTLPNEVIEVRAIYRRTIGSRGTSGKGGSQFMPFQSAHTNAYLMQGGGLGGLATYDFFAQKQELLARMFGGFIEFKWNTHTKKLTLLQRPRSDEDLLLETYNYRPDIALLSDYLTKEWIKDYTLAKCKYMLGEARSKFQTIAGPAGGTTLNGDTLKQEAQQELEKLEQEVATQMTGGIGYYWVTG